MKLFLSIISVALAANPCAELCEFDGPQICTGGSWIKGDVCHGYLYRGDPMNRDYCYHTVETAASCPSTGLPVLVSEARGLIQRATTPAPVEEETAAPNPPIVLSNMAATIDGDELIVRPIIQDDLFSVFSAWYGFRGYNA